MKINSLFIKILLTPLIGFILFSVFLVYQQIVIQNNTDDIQTIQDRIYPALETSNQNIILLQEINKKYEDILIALEPEWLGDVNRNRELILSNFDALKAQNKQIVKMEQLFRNYMDSSLVFINAFLESPEYSVKNKALLKKSTNDLQLVMDQFKKFNEDEYRLFTQTLQNTNNNLQESLLFGAVVFILIFLFTLILLYNLALNISTNIKSVASSLENIVKYQIGFDAKIDYHSKDEIGYLVNQFNNTIKFLSSEHNALIQTQEKLSKEHQIVDKYVAVSLTDKNGIIKNVSTAFCNLSGYSKEELIGKKHSIVSSNDTSLDIYEEMWEKISTVGKWNGELKNVTKDGKEYWIELNIDPLYDSKNNIVGYHSYSQSITHNKLLQKLAITDGLTNLYNRRYFNEVFMRQLKIAKRNNKFLIFTLMDIDYFKQYNDTYGHQAGDNALKKIAFILESSLQRAEDYAFRLGGEEFALLYMAEDKDNLLELVNKANENIKRLEIEHKNNIIAPIITVSMGVYIINSEDDSSFEEIYQKCDQALYHSKENGRDQITVA